MARQILTNISSTTVLAVYQEYLPDEHRGLIPKIQVSVPKSCEDIRCLSDGDYEKYRPDSRASRKSSVAFEFEIDPGIPPRRSAGRLLR